MTAKKGPGEIRRAPIAARMSLRARLARSLVRRILGPKLRDDVPLEDQRAFADRLARASRMPRGVTLRCADAGGVACEALAANGIGATAPRIVYLHGGAYCIGSPAGHRSLTAYLAGACQAEVVVPDYRLAPEHPFPAALDDAGAAWQAIRERHPDAPLVLAGDSAGGGLAVALTVSLRDAGQRLPDALALLSPWCELSEITETYASREHAEVMLTAGWLDAMADAYAGQTSRSNPLISPVRADLEGLPPTLIVVGDAEILLADSRRLAARMAAAGVSVTLSEWQHMWHVWQLLAGVIPEAGASLRMIADFVGGLHR